MPTIRLSGELCDRIRERAEAEDRSMASVVERALRVYEGSAPMVSGPGAPEPARPAQDAPPRPRMDPLGPAKATTRGLPPDPPGPLAVTPSVPRLRRGVSVPASRNAAGEDCKHPRDERTTYGKCRACGVQAGVL